ncbi:metalloregulator ArsR/SmtB family transcription factor [Pseudomonadales bacterium]|jgi:DNA-binding transcriptional ArsR family regulator|nr:metalloregulator ArsR/SmtB family transcription factor [Pseudomonadales bacterium]
MKDSKHQAIRVNSDGDIAQLADMFRLMGDPSRLRIILSCLHDPISVTEIAEQLELSQSLVSHHLRLLRAARVVASERRGKQIFYVAADEHIQCVIEDMVAHVSEPSQFEGDA